MGFDVSALLAGLFPLGYDEDPSAIAPSLPSRTELLLLLADEVGTVAKSAPEEGARARAWTAKPATRELKQREIKHAFDICSRMVASDTGISIIASVYC